MNETILSPEQNKNETITIDLRAIKELYNPKTGLKLTEIIISDPMSTFALIQFEINSAKNKFGIRFDIGKQTFLDEYENIGSMAKTFAAIIINVISDTHRQHPELFQQNQLSTYRIKKGPDGSTHRLRAVYTAG